MVPESQVVLFNWFVHASSTKKYFFTIQQTKKHLYDLAMEHGELGVESMIQLLEKSIHTVHELHKLLIKSGLLIIDDIRQVAKLIDTLHT